MKGEVMAGLLQPRHKVLKKKKKQPTFPDPEEVGYVDGPMLDHCIVRHETLRLNEQLNELFRTR